MSARWLPQAVFYQIHPQTFCDGNGDGVGDLAGIASKLDALAELGVNAIGIDPIYPSPFRDAGCDVADHCAIDPRYGAEPDFDRLLAGAHERGIRVCLTLVPDRTSDRHRAFVESARAERNASSDRYIWRDGSSTERDGALAFALCDGARVGAFACDELPHRPLLNYGFAAPTAPHRHAVDAPGPVANRTALKETLAFWLDRGVDGFRIERAATLVKGDPDKIANRMLWRDVVDWVRGRFDDRALIADWGNPQLAIDAGFDADVLASEHTVAGDLVLGPSSVPARDRQPYFDADGRGDFASFRDAFEFHAARVAGSGFIGLASGSRDTSRPSLGRDGDDLAVLFTFLLTWPVVPFIYYGDEIGMRFLRGLPSIEGGYERSGARTPMQWDGSRNAGFTAAAQARAALDPARDRPNVASQRADKSSLWHHVERLVYLRVTEADLAASARLRVLSDAPTGYPLVYQRGENLVVAINPGRASHRLRLAAVGDLATVLGQRCEPHHDAEGWWLRIGPGGYGVFSAR